jgi:phosphohistidine phosphatase
MTGTGPRRGHDARRRLTLLRHAKSSWDNPAADDHERPLNGRGRRAGQILARYFADRPAPDLILCSDSVRTRETLSLIAEGFATPPETRFERGLYLAGARGLLARLTEVPDAAADVLLIGHNPGLHELAAALAAHASQKLRGALDRKFPTGAVATYEFSGPWRELGRSGPRLTHFTTPAELAEEAEED